MRISDWSSDVCSSDLAKLVEQEDGVIAGAVEMPVPGSTFLIAVGGADRAVHVQHDVFQPVAVMKPVDPLAVQLGQRRPVRGQSQRLGLEPSHLRCRSSLRLDGPAANDLTHHGIERSEEHTSELQSLMRLSYAVFCLKKKNQHILQTT